MDEKPSGAEVHCILEPTEAQAQRACSSWLHNLTDAIPQDAYQHIPQVLGIVHANGSSVARIMPVISVGLSNEESAEMGVLIGAALTSVIIRNDPEEGVTDPIYAYFICADGYSAPREHKPKRRFWQRRTPAYSMSKAFDAGDPDVKECVTLHHITRTYVTRARRVYRYHAVDGFEWDECEVASIPTSKIGDDHPLWAYKWGEGPWKD